MSIDAINEKEYPQTAYLRAGFPVNAGNPHLVFTDGLWWCVSYRIAVTAPTVREVCSLWCGCREYQRAYKKLGVLV